MSKIKILMIFVLVICVTVLTFPTRFGGFYGTDWGNTVPPVQAFLDTVDTYNTLTPVYDIQALQEPIPLATHYTGGPYAAYVNNWDDYNNAATTGIDDYEFTYSCEHGAQWMFWVNDGVVNLNDANFGSGPDIGWGDDRVNWVVLYSCTVIATPEEVTDWWSVWMANNSYDVMDGVHMVMGFRTPAWIAPAVNVSTQFAHYICQGEEVLLKWFHAVWFYSYCSTTSYDKASAVFWPSSEHDTLTSYSADPSPDILYCWWY